jgi:hypothetical protein
VGDAEERKQGGMVDREAAARRAHPGACGTKWWEGGRAGWAGWAGGGGEREKAGWAECCYAERKS